MNDIKLHATTENKWDWTFNNGDIYNVTGVDAILNNIIHIILLRKAELLQYFYQNKGNEAYNYIRGGNVNNNILQIEEITQAEIEKHEDVATADITANFYGNDLCFSGVINLNNGREIELNGI